MPVVLPDDETGNNGSSGGSGDNNNFEVVVRLMYGFNGSCATFLNGSQVKVSGLSDNYVVKKSFPLLIAENSYTFVYYLLNAKDFTKGLYCPEAFLTLATEQVEVDSSHGEADYFDKEMSSDGGGIGSCFNAFKLGSYVRLKTEERVYKVNFSFLMLNSSSTSIICYELRNEKGDEVFYCPHSLLVRAYDYEAFRDTSRTVFIQSKGSNSGSSSENNS